MRGVTLSLKDINADFKAIQALAGQSDAATTLRYIHAKQENMEQIATELDEYLTTPTPPE